MIEQNVLSIIADLIKKLRKENGVSQRKLADKLDTSQPLLSRIENGRDNVTLNHYISVLTFFNYKINLRKHRVLNDFFDCLRLSKKSGLDQFENKMVEIEEYTLSDYLAHMIIKAYLFYFKRRIDECIELVRNIKQFKSIFNQYLNYRVNQLEGLISIKKGNYNDAEDYLEAAYFKAKECEALDELILYQLGWIYTKQKNITQSCLCLYDAEKYSKHNENEKRLIDIDNLLAVNYLNEHEYGLAIQYFITCSESKFAEESAYYRSQVIYNIGLAYFLDEKYEEAAHYFELSFNMDDLRHDHALSLSYLIKTLLILKDHKRIKQYKPFIKKVMNDQNQEGKRYLELVQIELLEGKTDSYYSYLKKKIIPILNKTYNRIRLKLLYKELSNYYWKHKQYKNYKLIVEEMMNLIM